MIGVRVSDWSLEGFLDFLSAETRVVGVFTAVAAFPDSEPSEDGADLDADDAYAAVVAVVDSVFCHSVYDLNVYEFFLLSGFALNSGRG